MQSTLFFRSVFPPPAPGAKILAGLYGAGAGRAADTDKTLVVQGVIRNIVFADEGAGLFESPVEKGVEFGELVGVVPLEVGHVLPVGRLFGADAGDPDALVLEGAVQGFYLADMAAGFSVFNGFVKSVGAVLGYKSLELPGIRHEGFDGASVSFERARPGGIGFWKKSPGIEGKNPDGEFIFENQVGNNLIFQPETGGKRYLSGILFREVTQVLDNTSVAQPGAQDVEPVGDDSHTNRELFK